MIQGSGSRDPGAPRSSLPRRRVRPTRSSPVAFAGRDGPTTPLAASFAGAFSDLRRAAGKPEPGKASARRLLEPPERVSEMSDRLLDGPERVWGSSGGLLEPPERVWGSSGGLLGPPERVWQLHGAFETLPNASGNCTERSRPSRTPLGERGGAFMAEERVWGNGSGAPASTTGAHPPPLFSSGP